MRQRALTGHADYTSHTSRCYSLLEQVSVSAWGSSRVAVRFSLLRQNE